MANEQAIKKRQPYVFVCHWPGVDPKSELAEARWLIEKHRHWRCQELTDAKAASKHRN